MFIYAFSDGIGRAIPFLVLPIIANYLTPADFGIATNFNVLVQVLTAFIAFSTSFGLAVDYYKGDKGEIISNLIYLMTLLFLAVAIVTILVNHVIYNWIQLELKWQLYALLTAYLGSINQLYNTKARYDEKARLFGLLQFLRAVTAAGLSLLFVITFKWDWQGRIQALVFSGIIMAIISGYLFVKDRVFPKKINWKVVYSYFVFGIPLLPQTLSQWLRNGFEKILITKQVSLTDNGLYSFASTIGSIFFLFTTSFLSAYTPHMFKTLADAEKNPEKAVEMKIALTKKSGYFMIGLLVILLAGYGITILLIESFFSSEYRRSAVFMPYVLVIVYLSALTSLFSAYLLFAKKTKMMGVITIIGTIIQVLFTYFLVTKYGTIGAPIGGCIAYLLILVMLIWYSQKIYPMPWLKVITK